MQNSYGGRHLQAPVTKANGSKPYSISGALMLSPQLFFHWQLYSGTIIENHTFFTLLDFSYVK